ncbi:LuxR C-terminal-related transcriptional regulator [Geodermatophilus sp. SYSU D00758]
MPKIQVPRIATTVLDRPRLMAALGWSADDPDGPPGEPGEVVAVSAPAGYGKTTLLAARAQALRARRRPVGWVTCDRFDADPVQLWAAVLATLAVGLERSTADPAAARALGGLSPPPALDPPFLAEFAEAVDAVGEPVTLVLDDVHVLTGETIRGDLAELVRNLPEQLRLVLGSRRRPGPLLQRVRLAGRLREVGAGDLAFTREEIGRLLRDQRAELGEADLDTLWHRTEGWPAAVRLAGLALAGEPDPSGFVARFAGDDTAIADYLVSEILSRQPEHVHRFLLDTSVAEELTVELAAALSGRADAGALLDGLERANALVNRLGRLGTWYRYHALLRTFLVGELHRRDLVAARERHARAARWFADAGQPGPALEHAVAAHDDAAVRDLLAGHGLTLLLSGQAQLIARVLATAPPAVLGDPDVALLGAITALQAGDLEGADRTLARFRTLPEGAGDRTRRLRSSALLYRARLRADLDVLRDGRVVAGPSAADGGDIDADLLFLLNRATLRVPAGDEPGAMADALAALDLGRRYGRDHVVLDCLNLLSGVCTGTGDLPAARRWAQEAIEFAGERGWGSSPRLAYSHVILAWAAYQALDLETASREAPAAVALLQQAVEPEIDGAARSGEAIIAFDRPHERRAALRRLERLWERLPESHPSPHLTAFAGLAEVHMSLALGERGRAAEVVTRVARVLGGTGDADVLRALTLLDRGRHDQARAAVAPVLSGARATTVVPVEVTAWLVEAVAAGHAGMSETAHRAVLRALVIGGSRRVLRPFYDLGPPLRELLLAAIGRAGPAEPFLAELLGAWAAARRWQDRAEGATAPAGEGIRGGPVLLSPLTAREVELLHDLPSMLTVEEIAAQHVVSVNTVKTHLRSLYRKLGVATRRDAVAAARRMYLA